MFMNVENVIQGSSGPIPVNQDEELPQPDINHVIQLIVYAASKSSPMRNKEAVAEGATGKEVCNGALWHRIVEKYGITHDAALLELQLKAVDGMAGKRVRNGEPWIAVASQCRITPPWP